MIPEMHKAARQYYKDCMRGVDVSEEADAPAVDIAQGPPIALATARLPVGSFSGGTVDNEFEELVDTIGAKRVITA